jgi:hypothetical protein
MPEAARITVLSPVPELDQGHKSLAPPLPTLRDRTLGLRYEWLNFETFVDRLEGKVLSEGRAAATRRWDLVMEKRASGYARATEEDKRRRLRELEEFASGIDAAVVGIAA